MEGQIIQQLPPVSDVMSWLPRVDQLVLRRALATDLARPSGRFATETVARGPQGAAYAVAAVVWARRITVMFLGVIATLIPWPLAADLLTAFFVVIGFYCVAMMISRARTASRLTKQWKAGAGNQPA